MVDSWTAQWASNSHESQSLLQQHHPQNHQQHDHSAVSSSSQRDIEALGGSTSAVTVPDICPGIIEDGSTKRPPFERLTLARLAMSDTSTVNPAHCHSTGEGSSSLLHKRSLSEHVLSDDKNESNGNNINNNLNHNGNRDFSSAAKRSCSSLEDDIRLQPYHHHPRKEYHRVSRPWCKRSPSSRAIHQSNTRHSCFPETEKVVGDGITAGSSIHLGGNDGQVSSVKPDPRMAISTTTAAAISSVGPPPPEPGMSYSPYARAYDPQTHVLLPKQQQPQPPKAPSDAPSWDMLREPDPRLITEAQLLAEVKGIYAGLLMVERKCIQIDRQQSQSTSPLTHLQWQALTALHRTLLHEHHDFFLASQHPSASPILKTVAEKYAMPARLWRYGIHSYLELLRHRLPQSFDHMVTFIYIAYSVMTLLLESVWAFEETWIECLGDLARYQMAVQEYNMHTREVWGSVARYWYNKVADRSPNVGRIQHHLAVLSRPDIIQQLYYYTKSLVSVDPFPNARESILLLFNPLSTALKTEKDYYEYSVASAFVCAHGCLFMQSCTDEFIILANCFLLQLDDYIAQIGPSFRRQGAYMASSNFAAIFGYGRADAFLPAPCSDKAATNSTTATTTTTPLQEVYASAMMHWASQTLDIDFDIDSHLQTPDSQSIFCGSYLAFLTLSIILNRIGDKNVLPAVHLSLVFIWCMALGGYNNMRHIEDTIPWSAIASFLTSMSQHAPDPGIIVFETFPIASGRAVQQLPEDFLIRGQKWSQFYFPADFFKTSEDDERTVEFPHLTPLRVLRCLWLGVRIASFNRWLTYDQSSKKFTATPFALQLEQIAEKRNPFRVDQVISTPPLSPPAAATTASSSKEPHST